jgi:leader peptidase (prepilin peptidase) / N-methyltransferase
VVNFSLPIFATICAFALAGGWGATQVIRIFSERRFSFVIAVAICAGLGLWAFHETGWTAVFAISLVLAWTLFALAAIDAFVFRLPDLLTFPLAAAGILVAYYPLHEPILAHLAGAAIGFGAFAVIAWGYARIRGREGLGFGDAKLAGVAGAWLGWAPVPSVILIACAAGLMWVGAKAIVRGRTALGERVPFGVALAIAIWIVWLYGPLEFAGA